MFGTSHDLIGVVVLHLFGEVAAMDPEPTGARLERITAHPAGIVIVEDGPGQHEQQGQHGAVGSAINGTDGKQQGEQENVAEQQ
jgi:hypothetical protein